MPGSRVTVLCVDDHNLVRECVVAIIAREPGLSVVAEARTVKGAVKCFAATRPDVTVVGLHPRGADSLQAIREIRRTDPRARIVVYASDTTEAVYVALDAGATGLVDKGAGSRDLIRVITETHRRNGAPLDDVRREREARGHVPTLTARELEILELMAHGLRIAAISATLEISGHTVKVHLKSVYAKLGVHGRAEALAEVLRRGFVRLATDRTVNHHTRAPIHSHTRGSGLGAVG